MQCARALGTEGEPCARVSCVGMHMVRACLRAGHIQPNSYTCVCVCCRRACEKERRQHLDCVHVFTVCRPLFGSNAGPPPLQTACVVGASGPRGRKADAGGCGQDGLDLFRLRWWERSGKLRALVTSGKATALRMTPKHARSPGAHSCSLRGVSHLL